MLLTQEIFSLVEVSRICEKLLPLTLKEYLNVYSSEVEDYYEVNVPVFEETDKRVSVICLVDVDEEDSKKRRKKSPGRRAGLERRLKYRHRYTYQNPLNRIHGYLILEECEKDDNVLKVSVICSSFFSPSRGVGSDLMNLTLAVSKLLGYSDVILEIGNEHSQGPDSESEEEEEEDDFEDEEEEELYALMDTLSHEFWRKCMRYSRPGRPYYNIDQDYIEAMLHGYFVKDNDENEEEEEYEDIYELIDADEDSSEQGEPGDCEYGGYWYQKGKSSQAGIITFYEKFGFEEDKKMRRHFSAVPFPAYRKHITHSSL